MRGRTAILLATLCIGASASHAQAGIDFNATAGGGPVTSGGHAQFESYGLSNAIIDTNNRLITAPPQAAEHGLVDAAQGVSAADAGLPLGVLLSGPNGTLFTYDRLVAKPVLQLIGFDRSAPASGEGIDESAPALQTQPIITGIGSRFIELSSVAPALKSELPSVIPSPPPVIPPVVPEPSSVAILLAGVGLLWFVQGRSREHAVSV